MRNKRRVFWIVVLTAVMVFSFTSCNRSAPEEANNSGADFTVADSNQWKEAINAIMSGGDNKAYIIDVIEDISLPGSTVSTFSNLTGITITITGDSKISLASDSAGHLLCITNGQRLILQDVDLQGHEKNNEYSLLDISGGSVIMRGNASVSGNAETGVTIENSGRFTMQGESSVYGNTVTGGVAGGVYVGDGTTFIMQDNSSVYGNTTTIRIADNGRYYGGDGGGVYVAYSNTRGIFIMEGNASVYGNTAAGTGGGAYIGYATFRIMGGTVYGSDAAEGNKNTAGRGAALFEGNSPENNTVKVVGGVKQE